MSVKSEITALLEQNRGDYISGGDLAERLGVSRTAVWKSIKSLIEEGYMIDSVSGKGYCLKDATDVLSKEGTEKYLKDAAKGADFRFEIFETVGSTNEVIRNRGAEGEDEWLVAAAAHQSAGKGRRGRSFYSPESTGLYFSILLRPHLPVDKVTLITTAAAVALCRTLDRVAEDRAEIKWVNDVFMREKKVAGILTEAVFNAETVTLDYVIVGIGINIYEPSGGFPEEIRDIAGSVLNQETGDARNKILAGFLPIFKEVYDDLESLDFVEEYRERCFVTGRNVYVCKGSESTPARALYVDDSCRLAVRYEDGREEVLNSGEISVRPADG